MLDPTDPRAVLDACAAWIAEAERVPPDEPVRRREPAERAADAAARCLTTLPDRQRNDFDIGGLLELRRANALRLLGHPRDAEAREAFEAALALAPERPGSWYDLGLLHKWRGRWQAAFDANVRARELGGDRREVLFNLAIAATALGRGETAVSCWRALGMPAQLTPGGQAHIDGLPPWYVRVPSRSAGYGASADAKERGAAFELVWVTPISPVHGVVTSPTFRDAPVDYGDLIMWDGAPVGVAETNVPVFPLLEILRRGDERRMRFVGLEQQAGVFRALEEALPEGCKVFVGEERTTHLCVRCASGEVLSEHEHTPPEEHRIVYGKLTALPSVDLRALRDVLAREARTHGAFQIAVPELFEALGETKRAGQEHQAWRGIERVAIRKGIAG